MRDLKFRLYTIIAFVWFVGARFVLKQRCKAFQNVVRLNKTRLISISKQIRNALLHLKYFETD
jgi:hypothetical protein